MMFHKKSSFKKWLPLIYLSVGVVLVGIGLTQWASGASFEDVQASVNGHLIEETFDPSTWFLLSVSTLDNDQRDAYRAIVARFADDPDALRDLLVKGIDENLASIDLSYLEDIEPMIGVDGTRFVFGLAEDGDDAIVVQAGLTLEDPEAAQALLTSLEAEGRFIKKNRDNFDLYYNVYVAESATELPEGETPVVYHFALYEDLFLVASSEDDLMNMLNRARSEGDESLWTSPLYQAVVEELPAQHVGWVYMDSQALQARQEAISGQVSSLASGSTNAYLQAQGLAVVVEDDRVSLEGVGLGDREKLALEDTTLDRLHAKARYLHKDMPAEKIMTYFESYNLGVDLTEATTPSDGESSAMGTVGTVTELLGIPAEDLASFLQEGYALGVNRNSGFLPGISVLVDASDASLTARGVLDAVDAQLTSLIGIFKFQGGAIADALTKETATIDGGDFDVIRLDVDSVLSLYQSYGQSFVLPEALQGLQVVLLYGLTSDDRLVISNFEGWLTESFPTLANDTDFEEVTDGLDGYKEGVFFLDFDELTRYLTDFQLFREALRADATSMAELFGDDVADTTPGEVVTVEGDTVEEGAEPVVEAEVTDSATVSTEVILPPGDADAELEATVEEAADAFFEEWMNFLEPLKSFGFSSEVDKYEIRLQGVLLFD